MSIADLGFPQVTYRRTALKTVVCQLQFNPILRIGQELPAAFQDVVRGAFPKLQKEDSIGFRLGGGEPNAVLQPPATIWRFKSEDEHWTIGLAIEFLSLEANAYQHYPEFERQFKIAFDALQATYGIDHFTRVGLRYINEFDPAQFPGGWSTRFNSQLLGPLADPAIGPEIGQCQQVFVLSREDWSVSVRHGTVGGTYRIDMDHAVDGRVSAENVMSRLRAFNDRLYQLFRWSITETLHQEMEASPRG